MVTRQPDLVVTGHADPTLVDRAVEAPASSVLPKNGSLPDLMDALETAGKGGLLVHPDLVQPPETPAAGRAGAENPLSPRERDAVAMLAPECAATPSPRSSAS